VSAATSQVEVAKEVPGRLGAIAPAGRVKYAPQAMLHRQAGFSYVIKFTGSGETGRVATLPGYGRTTGGGTELSAGLPPQG
jgi:hypothetical protein